MSGSYILDRELHGVPVQPSPMQHVEAEQDGRGTEWTGLTLDPRFDHHCPDCGCGFRSEAEAQACCNPQPAEQTGVTEEIYRMRMRGATSYEIRDALMVGDLTAIYHLIHAVDLRIRREQGLSNADCFSRWRIRQRKSITGPVRPTARDERARAELRIRQRIEGLEAMGYLPGEVVRKTGYDKRLVERICDGARRTRMMELGMRSRFEYYDWRDERRRERGVPRLPGNW